MSKKQARALVVSIIEDVIALIGGTAAVAGVIMLASLLLKKWGAL